MCCLAASMAAAATASAAFLKLAARVAAAAARPPGRGSHRRWRRFSATLASVAMVLIDWRLSPRLRRRQGYLSATTTPRATPLRRSGYSKRKQALLREDNRGEVCVKGGR